MENSGKVWPIRLGPVGCMPQPPAWPEMRQGFRSEEEATEAWESMVTKIEDEILALHGLYGEEGNGKSYLAMATGQELKMRNISSVLSVSCTNLLSKVVGESEEKITKIFMQARRAAPCLLILDEIQTIAPKRGTDSTNENTFDRLLSCLLVEMDGIGKKDDECHVFVLGITRDISKIDDALLRPGRLDCTLKVRPPTKKETIDLQTYFSRRTAKSRNFANGDEDYLSKLLDDETAVTRANVLHWHQDRCFAMMREKLLKLQTK